MKTYTFIDDHQFEGRYIETTPELAKELFGESIVPCDDIGLLEELKLKDLNFFTFGMGQEFSGKYVVIEGTIEESREQMFARFGRRWSFQYTLKDWVRYGESMASKWGWTELTAEDVKRRRPYYFTFYHGTEFRYNVIHATSEAEAELNFKERFYDVTDYKIYYEHNWTAEPFMREMI